MPGYSEEYLSEQKQRVSYYNSCYIQKALNHVLSFIKGDELFSIEELNYIVTTSLQSILNIEEIAKEIYEDLSPEDKKLAEDHYNDNIKISYNVIGKQICQAELDKMSETFYKKQETIRDHVKKKLEKSQLNTI